jgi:hypothetical protein
MFPIATPPQPAENSENGVARCFALLCSQTSERNLTLLVSGVVKVDLANFVFKFRTKFLFIRFFKNYLFLQKHLLNLFELLT